MGAALRVRPALRSIPTWDLSGVLLWALGTAVATAASFYAAAAERAIFMQTVEGGGTDAPASVWGAGVRSESLRVSLRGACTMVAGASAFLGALYLLSRWGVPIVYFVLAFFAIGSAGAFSAVCMAPCLRAVLPLAAREVLLLPLPTFCTPWCTGDDGEGESVSTGPVRPNALRTLASVASAILVISWLALRHKPGAWVVQDLLGVALCCLATAQLRLQSLRSAALLLAALFCYDVFMVFGTPLLLPGGDSVMVEVATAGAAAPVPAGLPTPACYCRLFPRDSKVCAPGELMPILFAMPRVNDWRGGFAMLGLGDIVVPALALAVALRFDYLLVGGGGGESGADGRDAESGDGSNGEERESLLAANLGAAARTMPALDASPRRRAASPADGGAARPAAALALPLPIPFRIRPAACAAVLPILFHGGWVGYWAIGVAGYAVGLAAAQVAVVTMQLGQPALLYLVPCVLVPIVSVARVRGHLEALWLGTEATAALPAETPTASAVN